MAADALGETRDFKREAVQKHLELDAYWNTQSREVTEMRLRIEALERAQRKGEDDAD